MCLCRDAWMRKSAVLAVLYVSFKNLDAKAQRKFYLQKMPDALLHKNAKEQNSNIKI